MLIAFFLILLIGLAGFAFVFTKALKSRAMPESVLLRPFDKLPRPVPVEPPPVTGGSDQVVQLKALCAADEQKIMKLEQMINEKNGMIADLQKGFQSSDDHQAQVDGLKQILQAQIEELKQQNKQLKSEVARLSDENIDLQTKVYAGQISKPPVAEQLQVHPVTPARVPEAHAGNIQVNSLSLHDVFGGEEEKNS